MQDLQNGRNRRREDFRHQNRDIASRRGPYMNRRHDGSNGQQWRGRGRGYGIGRQPPPPPPPGSPPLRDPSMHVTRPMVNAHPDGGGSIPMDMYQNKQQQMMMMMHQQMMGIMQMPPNGGAFQGDMPMYNVSYQMNPVVDYQHLSRGSGRGHRKRGRGRGHSGSHPQEIKQIGAEDRAEATSQDSPAKGEQPKDDIGEVRVKEDTTELSGDKETNTELTDEEKKQKEEEAKEKKLAAIRAMREEQAAKNRELAEQRKKKIEEMKAADEERRKRTELASAAKAAALKKRSEELRLKRDKLLAEKEAELRELRRQLEEKKKQKRDTDISSVPDDSENKQKKQRTNGHSTGQTTAAETHQSPEDDA